MDKDFKFYATEDKCIFQDDEDSNVAVGDRVPHTTDLYTMRFKVHSEQKALAVSQAEKVEKEIRWDVENLRLWHERFANPNFAQVKYILKNNNIVYSKGNPPLCDACVLGKMHRWPFPENEENTTRVGEILHTDLCGPMEMPSLSGAKYFLLFKDDFSSFTTVYFLKAKSEVKDFLAYYLQRVEQETGVKINILRSDNGLEFINQTIRAITFEKGIQHQRTVVYTPQQNGKAERENRTLVEAARTQLLAKKLPKKL